MTSRLGVPGNAKGLHRQPGTLRSPGSGCLAATLSGALAPGFLAGAVLALALCALPGTAQAQAYPARPIRLIVPQTPGLLLDNLSRIMAAEMSKDLGTAIVVENRPGADGAVAYEFVARQVPADGYTLVGSAISNLAVLPLTSKDLRFDPLKDLPPFIVYAVGRLMLGSSSTLPWKNFGEMVAHARANPGKLNYGSVNANLRLVIESIVRELGNR